MAKEKQKKLIEYPLRLIFGGGSFQGWGFTALFEDTDGTAVALEVRNGSDFFSRIRFINKWEGDSRIVFEQITTPTRKGAKIKTILKGILIRKDFHGQEVIG